MRSYLFFLMFIYFLLLLCCFACECIHTEQAGKTEDVGIFVPKETHVILEYGSQKDYTKQVKRFCSPTLVYADGVLVAFAEATYTDGYQRSADVVARNITVNKDDWKTKVLSEDSWNTHVAASKNKDGVNAHYNMMNPGAVVNDKNIYLIAGSKKTKQSASRIRQSELEDWDIELVVGDVNEDKGKKVVNWNEPTSLRDSIINQLKLLQNKNVKTITGSAGVPIVTSNAALVFILKVETKENKPFNVIARSKDNGSTWETVHVITEEKEKYPAVVEWEDGKLIVMTSNEGYRKVYRLDDDWKPLAETGGMLSRVWGNNKKRDRPGNSNSIIKANISGKNVLLFAQPVEKQDKKYQLHLWMTNGYRFYNAGPVADEQNSDFSSVLLYADDMLFLLYDRPEIFAPGYFLRPLGDALERVKAALGTWAKQDAALSKPCGNCDEFVDVKGLVGFLSDSDNTTHWADKYLCVNATVSKAVRKVKNGFEFKEAGSGAQWLVDTKEQNHPYHFANYEFTLVATVVIHEVPRGISPVLSLSLGEKKLHTRRLALWYDEKKRWSTEYSPDDKFNAELWEPRKAYLVALTLQEEKGHVYVDGKQLGGDIDMSGLNTTLNVSHFSIGRDIEEYGASYGHMTVTDVFLYNRKLSDSVFKGLVRRKERLAPKLEAPGPTPTPQGPGVHTGSGGGVGGNSGGSEPTDTNIVSNGTGHAVNNTTGGRNNESSALEKDSFESFLNTHVSLALLLLLFVCGRGQLCLF